jgi:hypothetical protein
MSMYRPPLVEGKLAAHQYVPAVGEVPPYWSLYQGVEERSQPPPAQRNAGLVDGVPNKAPSNVDRLSSEASTRVSCTSSMLLAIVKK